jgi:hypothetical protein
VAFASAAALGALENSLFSENNRYLVSHTVGGSKIRDSSVGIDTGFGLDSRSSIPSWSETFSYTPQRPDWIWCTPNLIPNYYRWLRRPGLEDYHSPPYNVEVNNVEAILPLPVRFHGVVVN